jgi:hypothetical protein
MLVKGEILNNLVKTLPQCRLVNQKFSVSQDRMQARSATALRLAPNHLIRDAALVKFYPHPFLALDNSGCTSQSFSDAKS